MNSGGSGKNFEMKIMKIMKNKEPVRTVWETSRHSLLHAHYAIMNTETIQAIRKSGFSTPLKYINDASDMPAFVRSRAYERIEALIKSLSLKVTLKKCPTTTTNHSVLNLIAVLERVSKLIDENPPSEGPRRFGNMVFRTFHDKLRAASDTLLRSKLGAAKIEGVGAEMDPYVELVPYFLGGFGSRQRLDFGTGHELSFLVFFGGLWAVDLIDTDISGEDILLIFSTYFKLIRRLILEYNLEPAGSHGVWGLDDHFHLPYILGSAQIVDITQPDRATPRFPPKSILRPHVIERERDTNLYFGAIDFIYKVKRGPFHDHSPILYDITGVATWHKIHRGMIKMYIAEVLGKFPVVQHFVFGSGFFPWTGANGELLPSSEPVEDQSPALSESYKRVDAQLSLSSGVTPVRAPWAK